MNLRQDTNNRLDASVAATSASVQSSAVTIHQVPPPGEKCRDISVSTGGNEVSESKRGHTPNL